MASELEFTGERMVPTGADENTFWEHIERYRFASRWIHGRDVLDIACGEGYGAAGLLMAGARSLIGVDVSEEAVQHAKARYGIEARVGDAQSIPLADSSIDVIISFETIEHVPAPEKFLDECVRILRNNGVLVISTPNIGVYHGVTPSNPFHCSEMDLKTVRALLSKRFSQVEYYGQRRPVPWCARVRGLGRLIRTAQRLFNPLRERPLSPDVRDQAPKLCSKPLGKISAWLTLDSVRKSSKAELNSSMYIVAVARLVRNN